MTWLKTIQEKTHGIKSACSCGIPNCGCKDTAAKFTSPQGSGAYDAGAAGAGPPAQFKNVTDTEDKGQYAEGAPGLNELGSLGKIIEK
jgi:hypothetical protein